MKYYVNKANEVFAFETSEEMEEFAKEPLTEITKAQADDLLKPTPEQMKLARIEELKSLLSASDYKALSDYDKPDPAIIEQRQAWREELRSLAEQEQSAE